MATSKPPSRPAAGLTPASPHGRIRPRRTAWDVVAGVAALIALAALMGGVPYALLRFAGPPLPADLLDGELLTSQISPSTAVAILVLLVWLTWAQLVVCVVVEVYSGIRKIGMPVRVPLSGGSQALANRLVSAALALFTASAVAIPIAGAASPPPARPPVVATQLTAPIPEQYAVLEDVREVKKVYVVQPPHGRHHESLWEIADKCLGDGRRYPEIYRLNQHKSQPDGSRLQMADLIKPGWVLDMPDDARNVHVVPADESRVVTLRHHPGKPAELDGRTQFVTAESGRPAGQMPGARGEAGAVGGADRETARPEAPERGEGRADGAAGGEAADGARQDGAARPDQGGAARPDQGGTGGVAQGGAGGAAQGGGLAGSGLELPPPPVGDRPPGLPAVPNLPAASAVPKAPKASAVPSVKPGETSWSDRAQRPEGLDRPQAQDTGGLDLVDYLAGGSLAAAGLLVALGRRRREQLWHRAFGHRIVRPRGDAAGAEVALRLGSDAPGGKMLDNGLRLLGKLLAEQGRVPPTIYAVHLSARGLDLWIHPPEPDAPEPWESHDGGRTWRLLAHEGRAIDEHALADVPAPYPGLVSLGVTESGRVLIDLEAAHGVIAMTGHRVREALAALAVELATNRWSDEMRVTLVGFGADLATIAPHRVRSVGSLAEALPELEARARETEPAAQVLTGRVHGRAAAPAWPPHFLLSAIAPDPDDAVRLARLGRAGTRMAAGYVIAGEVPHATWTWEITEEGKARVEALGVTVAAQLLPRRHYEAVVDLFRTAGRHEGEPVREEEPAREFTTTPSVNVRILGPIEIGPVPPLEEGRAELACEMIVYLASHPAGVHPVVLGGILWPRGVQAVVRDAAIARVAEWLGTDSQGRPNLRADDTGRLRLGPEVRSDWQLFRELVRRSHNDPGGRAVLLDKALGLVRGPLLSGRPRGRYAWLAADELEYEVTASVADAAHRLCEVRLAHDDAEGAVAAVRAGLLLAADDEGLWRDLLRSAHATGDPLKLRAVADGLHRRASSHPYGGGMAPETEALIDELLPTWRLHSMPSA
ncbi:bacterial transcriptional activator domain-containing protein [Sphaerisporangium sp. TRM90804]|uniref:bacterial transcriptional activator domain-containing protein n=1 Tax=Sphaerisporangium sp. TRM90804 TaxID=3031113 RepID=UPI00244A7A7B|nr:bacterial transcriptional activator domain-containing protein [Sphaerisporangium sp. TRM90804]MDH2423956.1 bacterial transcriptional activator domain-containing protein [Sphaerisporangium sp. TRM90804]